MTTEATTTELRRCIGSAKFGIEAHDAPVDDFPVQPSQKDGLGRMCKTHWRQYVRELGRARATAKKDEEPKGESPSVAKRRQTTKAVAPEPIRNRAKRGAKAVVAAAGSQGDAG